MHPIHRETRLIQRIGWLRAAVLGANDGIISTASLMVGVASAATSTAEVAERSDFLTPAQEAGLEPRRYGEATAAAIDGAVRKLIEEVAKRAERSSCATAPCSTRRPSFC